MLCNSRNSAERERSHLALLEQQRVQGILVTPVDPDSPALDEVARRGTPVVVVDRTRSDQSFCSVAVDDVLGGRLAVEHLVDRGHTRVAFVGGPAHLGQVRDRLQGAREAWAAAGLPADALTWIETAALTVAEGREAGARLAGIPARRRPTAAFCANDLVALGLLQQRSPPASGCPRTSASWATTTSSSPRPPPYPSPRCASRASCSAAPPPSWCSTRPTNPDHTHRQVLFTPELVARSSTQG